MRPFQTNRRAFTLIEILVVCAIIGLLTAILIPALGRAREQSKIGACKASLQQIGVAVMAYQSAEAGYVPVLFNYYAAYTFTYPDGTVRGAPARTRWASVPLRRYENVPKLSPAFNPEEPWDDAKLQEYEYNVVSKHWICPFVREGGRGLRQIETRLVTGQGAPQNYTIWEWEGRHESYEAWLWEDVVRGKPVRQGSETHPNDPTDGRPKYSVLTFNRVKHGNTSEPEVLGSVAGLNKVGQSSYALLNAHRAWSNADAQKRYSPSLSDMTMLFCAQGNFMAFDHHINNPDSHRTSLGPGTNTAFADGHVDWVGGTHIGWP